MKKRLGKHSAVKTDWVHSPLIPFLNEGHPLANSYGSDPIW